MMQDVDVYDSGRAQERTGDDGALGAVTPGLQRELHLHCYRMLGSFADADDALQETLVRAWRHRDRYEPRAPYRAWVYRIATNVCLTMLARRARRGEALLEEGEPMHLDPYPDRLLDEFVPTTAGPEAIVEHQESVELAFVAAVQILPPRQRATLLLRDVIGYSAAEVATMLATTVASVNSALQRARATLDRERAAGRVTRAHTRTSTENESNLVRRLAAAWHVADVPSIVALLTEDALLTMPPQPLRVVGREAIGAFLATVPARGRLDRFRFVPTRANRQPAVAAYYREGDVGTYHAYSVMVLAIEGEAIVSLVRFADPTLFPHFGLPMTYDGQ
jgi:RNA polymerase sigma-70 factor (ECF subfamily)